MRGENGHERNLLGLRLLTLLAVDDRLDRLQPATHLLDGFLALLVALLDEQQRVFQILHDVRRRFVRFTEQRQGHLEK